jgi:hypothetical protein
VTPLDYAYESRMERLAARESQRYRLRNIPLRYLRPAGFKAELFRRFRWGLVSTLEGTLIRCNCGSPDSHAGQVCPDGIPIDLGVLCRRVITDTGVQFLAGCFTNSNEAEVLNYHGSGTGGTAEAASQTALVTEVETRATGTQSNPTSNQYRSVGTASYTATRSITEHGLFSASTTGTMFDRSLFTSIGVSNGDSIQFTHTTSLPSGG